MSRRAGADGGDEPAARFVVQVSAGMGPSEVRAFVTLLAARLELLLRARGIAVDRLGADAQARSVVLRCSGPLARAAELAGTHELVHAARGRRQHRRWFAGVTLHAEPTEAAPLRADDVTLSAARAGGPGGQRVNKVSSAVRAVHGPSGVVVRAAGERSQRANRRAALARVAARLDAQAEAARAEAAAIRRAAHQRLERGAAVCRYRFIDGTLQLLE